MKKMLALVSALMLCAISFCASAEGLYEQVTARFTGELEDGAVVQVLENDTAIELGYVEALISAFNEAYKDKGVSAVRMNTDQYASLDIDGPDGYGPDVWYQANDIIMKYATNQHIQPLPLLTMESLSHVPQNAWDAYAITLPGFEGETLYCGVPVNVQSGMLYYIESMLPDNWKAEWDLNANDVPDFFETATALYAASKEIQEGRMGKTEYGYLDELVDTYFMAEYLFTYGAYTFGSKDTDPTDIGLNKGDAAKGVMMIRQWSALMNNTEVLDKTFASAAYNYLATGKMLCTVTTPDVYQQFIRSMVMTGKWTRETAEADLKVINVPRLPKSADLTAESWQDTILDMENLTVKPVMMGGINGYGISTWTYVPNAALAFVEFATAHEQVMLRNQMLGVTPARDDAAAEVGKRDPIVKLIFDNLNDGYIDVMPAINAMGQVWTPAESFFVDVATDALRKERGEPELYETVEKIQQGLDRLVQQINDALFTFS